MSVTWNAVGSDKSLKDITELTQGHLIDTSGDYALYMQADGNLVIYHNGTAVWAIGKDYSKVPELKSTSGTYTTNGNGNVDIGLSISGNVVLAIYCTGNNNTIITPLKGGTNWWASCVSAQAARTPIAETAVAMKIYYYKIA